MSLDLVQSPFVLGIAYKIFRPETIRIYSPLDGKWKSVDETDIYKIGGPLEVKASDLGIETHYKTHTIVVEKFGDSYRVTTKPDEVDVILDGPFIRVRDLAIGQYLDHVEFMGRRIRIRGEPTRDLALSA